MVADGSEIAEGMMKLQVFSGDPCGKAEYQSGRTEKQNSKWIAEKI